MRTDPEHPKHGRGCLFEYFTKILPIFYILQIFISNRPFGNKQVEIFKPMEFENYKALLGSGCPKSKGFGAQKTRVVFQTPNYSFWK